MRDLVSNMTIAKGVNQTLTGATPGTSRAIDTRAFDGLAVYMQTGTVTAAGTAGITFKIQHSDTLVGSDFADVPAIEQKGAIAAVTSNDDDDLLVPGGISYLGNKRYVRVVSTGSTNTNAIVRAIFVLGKPHRAPTTPVGATLATT
jgi:hypothetical protein